MSEQISQELLDAVISKGTTIGGTEPCAETKGSFWSVRVLDGKIHALSCWGEWGASAGYEINVADLSQYTDDPNQAARHVEQIKRAKEMGLR